MKEANARALRAAAAWSPIHAALPCGLAWLGRRHGPGTIELAVAAIHLAFPFVYLLLAGRVRFGFVEWAIFIGVSHVAVGAGFVALLLVG